MCAQIFKKKKASMNHTGFIVNNMLVYLDWMKTGNKLDCSPLVGRLLLEFWIYGDKKGYWLSIVFIN